MILLAATLLSLTLITLYILHARAQRRFSTAASEASIASHQTFLDIFRQANVTILESLDQLQLAVISSGEKSARASDTHTQAVLQVANSLEPLVTHFVGELSSHMDFIETSQRTLTTRVEQVTSASTMRVP